MKIPVGISNRHIHLCEEDKNILLGKAHNLDIKRTLNQPGEFASNSVLTIKTDMGEIPGVRVVGPLRKYTQVEILKSDESILKINAPYRNSGDLANSASITLVGPAGEVYKENSTIIANRHIHMNEEDIKKFNVNDKDIVSIKKENIIINDVNIKVGSNYSLECHLDKDDEKKYNIHSYEEVEIVKVRENE